ncbi:MAG: gamma-glutamylcyclotransferase [Acidimicrobiia bacterium]|nr:gamma-glutamylcyclotransferase [Acidimicrobiia bacterium]
MTPPPFAVYGTLRPGGRFWQTALATVTTDRRFGRVGGAALFDGPGFPLVADDPAAPGVLCELTWVDVADHPAALQTLDRIEGVDSRQPSSGLYRREVRTVEQYDGDGQPLGTVDAVLYLANDRTMDELARHQVTSGDWIAVDDQRRHAWSVATGRPYPFRRGVFDLDQR